MDLKKYIKKFDFNKIIKIEESDRQFLALKNAREKIVGMKGSKDLFLFLILQNSLISYQIAGSGEKWREEFADKIISDWNILEKNFVEKKDNIDWWYKFMTNSKYNKRIYNIKIGRLKKFEGFRKLIEKKSFEKYHDNMELLLDDISKIMNKSDESKTITFAVKMFGYGSRTVFAKFVKYPIDIQIPVDSRLKKIYYSNEGGVTSDEGKNKKINEKNIQKYFQDLAKKNKIPPLHLDSLLRIDYRRKYMK